MQYWAEWIEPLSISLEGLNVVRLDIYSPVQQNNNGKKKNNGLRSAGKANTSPCPQGWNKLLIEYSVTAQLLHKPGPNYYNFLRNVSDSHCVAAVASCYSLLLKWKQSCDMDCLRNTGDSSLSPLANYVKARQLARIEAVIRGSAFLKTVQMKKLPCALNSELLPMSPPYPEPFTRPIYLNWLSPAAGRTPRNAS